MVDMLHCVDQGHITANAFWILAVTRGVFGATGTQNGT